MKAVVSLPVLLLAALPLPSVRGAEDKKEAPVTGGKCAVEISRDVAYHEAKDADPVRHKLDLYLPKGRAKFPVLLFVHGGAWRSGSKQLYGPLGRLLAQNGIGAVIINYRLSPKVKHPAHIEDVARAFAWTHRNIGKRGGNPEQIFVCGHSAGGHLVALLGTNAAYLKAENLTPAQIKGVIPLSGVYVIRPLGRLASIFGNDADTCKTASPLDHVKEKHPPFLIGYADGDFRSCDRMSEQLCKALKDCRCAAECLKIADRSHVSLMVRMALSEDDPLFQAVLKFIARHSDLKLTPKK
jgi:acetyl esterase/lipase